MTNDLDPDEVSQNPTCQIFKPSRLSSISGPVGLDDPQAKGSDSVDALQLAALREHLRRSGVHRDVRMIDDSDDELILLFSSNEQPDVDIPSLTRSLSGKFGLKVWIAGDGKEWRGQGRPVFE